MLTVDSIAGGYGDIQVLWGVSASVKAGHVTVILGRNGAGKTSLLNAVAGFLPTVRSGHVRLGDLELGRLTPFERVRAGLAYVQEGKRVFHRRTVEENLLLGGYTVKRPFLRKGQRLQASVDRAYERFPMLADRRKMAAGRLSGGQQQMLAIAQALIPEPTVLMLDEPSAGLAPAIAKEVFAMVAELKREGLAVLLVEQVVDNALAIADDVIVIDAGRVAASGRVADFDDTTMVRDLYLGRGGVGPGEADRRTPGRAGQ
jgi:branched-chain amino acid transport system ATP-binding protein